jgi:prophage antirepressor-like protein
MDIVTNTPQENVIDISNEPPNILVKQFQHLNIEIFGTLQEPLFKAREIGDLLDIKKITKTIERLDDDCKILKVSPSGGGLQEQWFLTEDGLYESQENLLLNNSKNG